MLRIHQSSSITGTSSSDYLVSYPGHLLGGYLPLCRGAVGVFNSPSWPGNYQLDMDDEKIIGKNENKWRPKSNNWNIQQVYRGEIFIDKYSMLIKKKEKRETVEGIKLSNQRNPLTLWERNNYNHHHHATTLAQITLALSRLYRHRAVVFRF